MRLTKKLLLLVVFTGFVLLALAVYLHVIGPDRLSDRNFPQPDPVISNGLAPRRGVKINPVVVNNMSLLERGSQALKPMVLQVNKMLGFDNDTRRQQGEPIVAPVPAQKNAPLAHSNMNFAGVGNALLQNASKHLSSKLKPHLDMIHENIVKPAVQGAQISVNNISGQLVPGMIPKRIQDSVGKYFWLNTNQELNRIHLSVVACGDRREETLVMLKSALLFTIKPLHFHIFAENQLHEGFRQKLESWPDNYKSKFIYNIYNITYPAGENAAEWKKLFKPCASQRLFIPDILTRVDSMLYVDTDILFLSPLDSIWSFFEQFNATQLAGLAPEHESLSIGWYNRFARHPYYGKTGVNSGVMLMNLTRIRTFDWTQKLVPIYKKYKYNITWGDQDLLNILFHDHPELLFVYTCEWNYRPDHCMYSSQCKQAESHGIPILHGNRRVYHNEKQPVFKAVYDTIHDYELGTDMKTRLLDMLVKNLEAGRRTPCGKLADSIIKTAMSSFAATSPKNN